MDHFQMLDRLKEAGITFDAGLSNEEFDRIEAFFGFRFPAEIRSFFARALPVGGSFFNWRDLSTANLGKFHSFYADMEQSFLFDIEHNFDDLQALLSEKFPGVTDKEELTRRILDYVRQSPQLIPFYAHRCFFDGMDNMPIISFGQPVDSIFYGENFEHYLELEFLKKDRHSSISRISEQMRKTGIWYYLVG